MPTMNRRVGHAVPDTMDATVIGVVLARLFDGRSPSAVRPSPECDSTAGSPLDGDVGAAGGFDPHATIPSDAEATTASIRAILTTSSPRHVASMRKACLHDVFRRASPGEA